MTAHDWYVENRVAFATRTLERNDERLFTDHLSRCEECRLAVSQVERDLAWLPLGVPPVAPRPGLSRRLTEGALGRGRWAAWQRGVLIAATTATFLLLGLWVRARREVARLRADLETREVRLLAIQDSLGAILGAERVIQKTITRAGYEGGVLILYDQETQRWNAVVHDLPPARSGEVYKFWFVTNRGLLPGPELTLAGSRPTFLTLPVPGNPGDVVGATLTVGPPAGPSDQPQGIEVARLTF